MGGVYYREGRANCTCWVVPGGYDTIFWWAVLLGPLLDSARYGGERPILDIKSLAFDGLTGGREVKMKRCENCDAFMITFKGASYTVLILNQ